MQGNGAASPQEMKKAASPRRKSGGSPRAAAAEATKVELQRQLASLQKQLDSALQDLSQQRASSSKSEQVSSHDHTATHMPVHSYWTRPTYASTCLRGSLQYCILTQMHLTCMSRALLNADTVRTLDEHSMTAFAQNSSYLRLWDSWNMPAWFRGNMSCSDNACAIDVSQSSVGPSSVVLCHC